MNFKRHQKQNLNQSQTNRNPFKLELHVVCILITTKNHLIYYFFFNNRTNQE